MPLFSRRWLQQAVKELAHVIPYKQLQYHCTNLNSDNIGALHSQWEVAVIFSLMRSAEVIYEPQFGSSARPDLIVRPSSTILTEFAMDITSVSNEGVRKLNPIDDFIEEFTVRVEKHGLHPNRFSLDFGLRPHRWEKREVYVLAIPPLGKFKLFFNAEFYLFLDKALAGRPCEYHVESEQIKIDVRFCPNLQGMIYNLPWHDSPYSLEHNALFERLKRKYMRQMKRAKYDGVIGIVVCDCGTSTFTHSSSSINVTTEKIIREFLRRYPKLSFVVSLTPNMIPVSIYYNRRSVEWKLFVQPTLRPGIGDELHSLFKSAVANMPPPQTNARHARSLQGFLKGERGLSFEGQMPITTKRGKGIHQMSVRISSMSLLDLLAGRISYDDFMIRNNLLPSKYNPHPINPFRDARQFGDSIIDVRLVRCPDVDDDWIEFEFVGPDPATSPIT